MQKRFKAAHARKARQTQQALTKAWKVANNSQTPKWDDYGKIRTFHEQRNYVSETLTKERKLGKAKLLQLLHKKHTLRRDSKCLQF